MTRKKFNEIRSRLEMREKRYGEMWPKNNTEKFVAEIIEAKHSIDKLIEDYREEK